MSTTPKRSGDRPRAAAARPRLVKHQQLTRDRDDKDDVRIINTLAAPGKQLKPSLPASQSAAATSAASAAAVNADLDQNAAAVEQDQALRAAAQSTLLDLLANPAAAPASVSRFLAALPVVSTEMPPRQHLLLAKQCWEHLLDNTDGVKNTLGKMDFLRHIKLYCPTKLFRPYYRLEPVQLLVDALGSQVQAGTFLCQLRQSLSADGQQAFRPDSRKAQQLRHKLQTADLLMVVHTLGSGNVFSIDTQQLQLIKLAHLARHGPVAELESLLLEARHEGSSASAAAAVPRPTCHLVSSLYCGFPMLFQPLIDCRAGWLKRVSVLLRAGADATAVYPPWNCSALHMLFYRKSSKVKETAQVRAVSLLLQHGVRAVIDLADTNIQTADGVGSRSPPTRRTALLQAASAGHFQACRTLLAAGARADVTDSCNQSMLDYLFYLKHSNLAAHRRATVGYTCMQLYGMVNDFWLHTLVTEELEQDCRSCGRCRFLLASCSVHSDQSTDQSSSSESEHSWTDHSSESDSDATDSHDTKPGAQTDCTCTQ